jgi:5-formyltetrahydrofolate cyclo-ligase
MEHKDDDSAKLCMLKTQFRAAALHARDALEKVKRREKSRFILERLCGMSLVQSASVFFVYVSFSSEVETHGLIRKLLDEGKRVCVPCVDRESKQMRASLITSMAHDLAPGCFGILEPAPGCLHPVEVETIDIVIVPGAAFTADGFRIGYGGGYYDRFLKNCPAVSIGIAFDMQVVGSIPFDVRLDVPLEYVVTESRIIKPEPVRSSGQHRHRHE